ncbi:MAG TPA: hypothetical protein VF889_03220, partial [Bacteroidota bacterium]
EERVAAELRKKAEKELQQQQAEQEERRRQEAEEAEQYEVAVREAIVKGRRGAQEKKLRGYLESANRLMEQEQFDEALREVARALRLNPDHAPAQDLERRIYAMRDHVAREQELAKGRAEQRRRMEELQSRIEEQARRDLEEQKQRALREAKADALLHRIKELDRAGELDTALAELENLFAVDPGNAAGREIEAKIIASRGSKRQADAVARKRTREEESWREREEGRALERQADREKLKQDALATYRAMLKQAWTDGAPHGDEKAMIDVVKLSLGINEDDCTPLEVSVRKEAYAEALRAALRDGTIEANNERSLKRLRARYGVSAAEAGDVEQLHAKD